LNTPAASSGRCCEAAPAISRKANWCSRSVWETKPMSPRRGSNGPVGKPTSSPTSPLIRPSPWKKAKVSYLRNRSPRVRRRAAQVPVNLSWFSDSLPLCPPERSATTEYSPFALNGGVEGPRGFQECPCSVREFSRECLGGVWEDDAASGSFDSA